MNDLSTNLKDIVYLVHEMDRVNASMLEISSAGLSPAMVDEQRTLLQRELDRGAARLQSKVLDIVRFPPHHIRHQPKLSEFWADGLYEESVFIMTKYPRKADDPKYNVDDERLSAVIGAVRDSVRDAGFRARLASDRSYHPGLWDNLELYLLGSSRGVAIVQEKYGETERKAKGATNAKTLSANANVAMEWGWMRGLGTDVHYLIEEDATEPADYIGLLKSTFKWTEPSQAIGDAIKGWLRDPPGR